METEDWAELRAESRDKKMYNLKMSTGILLSNNIKFQKLSPWHYRIGPFDLWPTTGKFVHRSSRKWGRGVFNLIKSLK